VTTPLSPVTLTGAIVSLVPLTAGDATKLADVGLEPVLWRLQPRQIRTPKEMQAYVDAALAEQRAGASLPFTITRRADGAVIGSTRYMDLALAHKRLEIGATWLTPGAQRSGANVEAKLLLLEYAFEQLAIRKVVLKTEVANVQSRTAIRALGATEEGIFRHHLLADDGRVRDMVYYGILASDWPEVRPRLESRLARGGRASFQQQPSGTRG